MRSINQPHTSFTRVELDRDEYVQHVKETIRQHIYEFNQPSYRLDLSLKGSVALPLVGFMSAPAKNVLKPRIVNTMTLGLLYQAFERLFSDQKRNTENKHYMSPFSIKMEIAEYLDDKKKAGIFVRAFTKLSSEELRSLIDTFNYYLLESSWLAPVEIVQITEESPERTELYLQFSPR